MLLTQQYQDGHCNHYFFPTEGWEPVTRVHSDNHLWLVMDAYHIALEEGSVSYLDTQAPYFDGGSGTIWEHIKQSIRFTTQNMGAHGFPLMLNSDWNDMLYKVCRKEGREHLDGDAVCRRAAHDAETGGVDGRTGLRRGMQGAL